MANHTGTSGDDSLAGGGHDDTFDISQGGADTVDGGGGDDTIEVGAQLTADDHITGGRGLDLVTLDGDYSAGLQITPEAVSGIEQISFADGHTYDLTFADGDYDVDNGQFNVGELSTDADNRLHIDASAVTGIGFRFITGVGDDWVSGGEQADFFDLAGGGDDTAFGGGGNDEFDVRNIFRPGHVSIDAGAGDDTINAGAFDRRATLNGGDGFDTVNIGGVNSGVQVLSGAMLQHVESIILPNAGVHHIRLLDNLADASLSGGYLEVSGVLVDTLGVEIDGSREHDTSLHLTGGEQDDRLTGGWADDVLNISGDFSGVGGDDTALGGKGNDTFVANDGALTGRDVIDGGAGSDTLQIMLMNFAHVKLAGMVNVETVVLAGVETVTLADANVAAGRVMTIDASQVESIFDPVVIDGAAESDGRLRMLGAVSEDSLIGGAGADTLQGNAGADTLRGGGGADRFVYVSVDDSGPDAADLIRDLDDTDIIDLRGVDANSHKAGDQGFHLVDHFSGKAGQAVLSFDAAHAKTLLSLDVDGDGTADAVIQMTGDHQGFDNFVL